MKYKNNFFVLLITFIVVQIFSGCAAIDSGKELISGATSYFVGGEDNVDPPAELVEYTPKVQLEILWDESVGVGADEQFINLDIAINNQKIIAADKEGLVQARDIHTGQLIWEAETEYNFSAGPGIEAGIIVLGTSNAEVVAFNLESGEQLWVAIVSSEILAHPVIADKFVVIRTTDGLVTALDKTEGKPVWTFERSVPALSLRGAGIPVVVDENIIAGYANGKLLELRLEDGKSGWETSIAIPSGRSEVERLVDLDVDPIETNGVVFVSSYQSGTTAVLASDGDVLWRNEEVSSSSGMSYDWRYIYVSDSASHVWQLDQRNGASLWKLDLLSHRTLTTPVAYDDYVVVGDFEGYVHWLSRDDGEQLGRINVDDSAIVARPIVKEGVVYVYLKDGTLAALKASGLNETE